MKKVIEHLEVALAILKPARDKAKKDYDRREKFLHKEELDKARFPMHEFVVYHNMCVNVNRALYLAKNPEKAGHEQ